jgi:hypothetical protein
LYAVLGNVHTVLWLTPQAAVVWVQVESGVILNQVNTSANYRRKAMIALARPPTRIDYFGCCSRLLRQVVHSVHLGQSDIWCHASINASKVSDGAVPESEGFLPEQQTGWITAVLGTYSSQTSRSNLLN